MKNGRALRQAAGRGEIETVKHLIYRGCDPGGVDGKGWTGKSRWSLRMNVRRLRGVPPYQSPIRWSDRSRSLCGGIRQNRNDIYNAGMVGCQRVFFYFAIL